jgi:hypothetical protein
MGLTAHFLAPSWRLGDRDSGHNERRKDQSKTKL